MKTGMFVKIATSLSLATLAVACGGSAANPAGSTPPLAEGGGSGVSAPGQGLIGSWQLVGLTESGQPPVTVAQPERFTVDFGVDGHVSLLADCNRCSGGYTTKGDSLSVGPMACTRAYCSSAPLDMNFTALLSQATAWTTSDKTLELRSDAGVLRLRR